MTTTLHYIHDPLCGWCYAAAPLVKAARETVTVVGHAGGMLTGSRRREVTPEFRDFILPNIQRIRGMSGQEFGSAYTDGLLKDTSVVLDSAPPTAAILAAEKIAGRGLDLLSRIQKAHYVEGQKVSDQSVLMSLAKEIGLDEDAFAAAMAEVEQEELSDHIAASRDLLNRAGGQGFPTALLEKDGKMARFEISQFLGKPDEFKEWLKEIDASAESL